MKNIDVRKHFLPIFALFLILLVGANTAQAKQQDQLQWNVHWGQNGWTHWYASADPSREVRATMIPYWGSGSTVTHNLTPNLMHRLYKGDNHVSSAKHFFLTEPGADRAFASMGWSRGTCPAGPKIDFNITPEQRLTIENTTGQSLWLFRGYDDSEGGKEIAAGETLVRKAGGPEGEFLLQVSPDTNSWNTCATIHWWLPNNNANN